MKKILAIIILLAFCYVSFSHLVDAKTNSTKKKTVSANVKIKYGHKHTTYTRKQHYKK